MRQTFLLLVIFIAASSQTKAQTCIDTVRIKGYYIVIRMKNEIGNPKVNQKDKTTKVVEQNIDVHSSSTFIPLDSIDKNHSLAYRLNHVWDNTKQVFISCEKIALKYLSSCSAIDTSKQDCTFPILKTSKLYYTTNQNSSEVYEIYCMDAYWIKITMKTDSIEASMLPSRIAQTSVTAREFDLYYFLENINTNLDPVIKDPKVKIWKK